MGAEVDLRADHARRTLQGLLDARHAAGAGHAADGEAPSGGALLAGCRWSRALGGGRRFGRPGLPAVRRLVARALARAFARVLLELAGGVAGIRQGLVQGVVVQGGGHGQVLLGGSADHLGLGVAGLDRLAHALHAALAAHAGHDTFEWGASVHWVSSLDVAPMGARWPSLPRSWLSHGLSHGLSRRGSGKLSISRQRLWPSGVPSGISAQVSRACSMRAASACSSSMRARISGSRLASRSRTMGQGESPWSAWARISRISATPKPRVRARWMKRSRSRSPCAKSW